MNLLRKIVVVFSWLVILPASAYAQASISGVVKDVSGAVLPGVTVTATSPALLGTQAVTSEANGVYRFPNLPAGVYSMTFELQGFQTLKRENIKLVMKDGRVYKDLFALH